MRLGKACAATLAVALACAPIAKADEPVSFDSAVYRVGELQQRLARERGEPIVRPAATRIEGSLSKPDGDGPFPAIVNLHGCTGLSAGMRKTATDNLPAKGYVSLVVDSFTTRGITHACDTAMPDRKADAVGALLYLSKLSFVDPRRIALVGRSQGGIAALQVAALGDDLFEMPQGLHYKAVVAFYPACGGADEALVVPTLILIGDRDDWSPLKDCERFMARLGGKGAPAKLVVYPGAYHAFDFAGAGDGIERFGHWLKYDAAATREAAGEVLTFLSVELGQ